MTFTLCSSQAIIRKAGANANSDAIASSALLYDFCSQAESQLCMKSRYDWIANYSSVSTNFKPVLAEATAALAAMKVINYDMGGYTSKTEAQTMLDVLNDSYNKIVTDLENKEIQDVMLT